MAQPAPAGRLGGWLGAHIDHWWGTYGRAFADQMWGSRPTPDGIRLLETFTLTRDLGYPSYDAVASFDLVAPLRRAGSLRLGLSPEASWVSSDPESRVAGITPSAGVTINADDWDFMVAPDELTYRGPGVKFNANYSISDVHGWLAEFSHRLWLDASAPWTVRFGRTRLEVGPDAYLFYRGRVRLVRESRSLGAHALLGGGSRIVDVFAAPEYCAADGPGWDVLATMYHWAYTPADTVWDYPDYLYLQLRARVQARMWQQSYIESGLTIDTEKEDGCPMWPPRPTPRIALTHLWPLGRRACSLARLARHSRWNSRCTTTASTMVT